MAASKSEFTCSLCVAFLCIAVHAKCLNGAAIFDQNYEVSWGQWNVINQGYEIQLGLDPSSGSGFRSKLEYASGFFEIKLKLPTGRSHGVITTFYLTSAQNNEPKDHDELDFEFMGADDGKSILQTNVYTMDNGCREERYNLWFNPSEDYHLYQILWNQHQIVFFIDNLPIRVFNNYKHLGVKFPSFQMHVEASMWDGSEWAPPHGVPIEWSQGPFRAHYQNFDIFGCQSKASNIGRCYSSDLWWNTGRFTGLDELQRERLEKVRKYHLTYDYCTDPTRNGRPECHIK